MTEVTLAKGIRGGVTARRSMRYGPGLSYGTGATFSPREVAVERAVVTAQIGVERLCAVHQVHGATVVRQPAEPMWPEGDAHFTTERGIALSLVVADCCPVLFAAPDDGVIAAAHCGWRGTALNLVATLLNTIESATTIPATRFRAWIGPAASGERYEVSRTVAERFPDFGDAIRPGRDGEHFLLDIRRILQEQCVAAGLIPEQISTDPRCTIEDDDLHSYRRDGIEAGRTLAWIVRDR